MPTATFTKNTTGGTSTAIRDVNLLEGSPDANFADPTEIGSASQDGTTIGSTSILKLTDLSSIPAGSTITGVSIELYCVPTYLPDNLATVAMYRVLPAVVFEQATWNRYSTGNNWATPGGLGSGTDHDVAAVGTLEVDETAEYKTVTDGGLIALVQGWLDGAIPNNGILFKLVLDGDEDWYSIQACAGTDGQRPIVSVTYTTGSATDPTITDVDGDEAVTDGQTGVAVTGTNLGANNAARTFSLRQGGTVVPQVETGSGSATGATLTIATDQSGADIKFGAATLRVTRVADSVYGNIGLLVVPASGQLYTDVGTPNTTAADRITAAADIASGDQLHVRGMGGGAAPSGLHIEGDGTFWFEAGATPAPFDVRVWDSSDSTWGAWATQSIAAVARRRRFLALLGVR